MVEMRSAALALGLSVLMGLSTISIPDEQTIIQNSVAVNQRDWEAEPQYSYFERVQKGGSTKTYHVHMILGSPYEQLVAVNNEPLPPDEQAAEQQKLEEAFNQRREESPQARADRIANYEKERKRDRLMMEQLSKAFDFKLVGRQKLHGFDVYVLKASPREGYEPPTVETEALTGMAGTLWIDQKTFQWVKVEAKVVHPVSIEGFLARVEPGTHFELEKMPVGNGIWLPSHFAMKSQARILFIFPTSRQEDETYYDYQKEAP
jgi:hypothetical protein